MQPYILCETGLLTYKMPLRKVFIALYHNDTTRDSCKTMCAYKASEKSMEQRWKLPSVVGMKEIRFVNNKARSFTDQPSNYERRWMHSERFWYYFTALITNAQYSQLSFFTFSTLKFLKCRNRVHFHFFKHLRNKNLDQNGPNFEKTKQLEVEAFKRSKWLSCPAWKKILVPDIWIDFYFNPNVMMPQRLCLHHLFWLVY